MFGWDCMRGQLTINGNDVFSSSKVIHKKYLLSIAMTHVTMFEQMFCSVTKWRNFSVKENLYQKACFVTYLTNSMKTFTWALAKKYFLLILDFSLVKKNCGSRIIDPFFSCQQNGAGMYKQIPIFLLLTKNLPFVILCKYGNFSKFLDSLLPFQEQSFPIRQNWLIIFLIKASFIWSVDTYYIITNMMEITHIDCLHKWMIN